MLPAAARLLSLSALLIALVGAPNAAAAVDASFNFQPSGTPTVSGYTPDNGAPFSTTSGRGWVRADSLSLPSAQHVGLNLATATRDRNLLSDQLLDTFIHLRHPTNGLPEGAWEYTVPNGEYTVTVSVGDQKEIDSEHVIRAEDTVLVDGFVPTATTRFATGAGTVTVSDGRLTISQTGGTNSKLDWIRIKSVEPTDGSRPAVGVVSPADGVTNVYRDRAVTAEVVLPNVGGGVDKPSLTSSAVFLTRVSDGARVNATVNTTGGGDAIILQPRDLLDANTQYRFTVTDAVLDTTGAHFIPKTTTFTTGTGVHTTATPVRFRQVPQTAGAGAPMASLAVGPDHRLYVTTLDGRILRFPIAANGDLTTPTTINTVKTHEGVERHIIGLAFDPASTASNPILWVTHSAAVYTNGPNWTGKISRLSGTDLSTIVDYVVGLPRSVRDHETNSLAFGPDGALYVNQGSLSAMGAPDNAWGDRPEEMLSAAVLRVSTAAITSPPLNVKTAEGGTYDPFKAGAPLTIYASGVRNAFDLVWHSNGQLYVPVNGSAAGGAIPGTPSTLPASCAKRIDFPTRGAWTGPATPARAGALVQPDILLSVKPGKYYGHPNPSRCEYAAFGGNPTGSADPFEETVYPVGTLPDRNWTAPIWNFGDHFSPNGVIEYHGTQWGGALDGSLLVVRYSAGDDVVALKVGATDGSIAGEAEGIPGLTGLEDPLDITQDRTTGNLYVTENTSGRVVLMRPDESGAPDFDVTPKVHYEDSVVNTTTVSSAVSIQSTGSAALSVSGLQISGPQASAFTVTSATTLPLTVAVGTSSPLQIAFKPTTVGISTATLTVTTNAGTQTVELRGVGTAGTGGTLEPSLQRILDLYKVGVDVGDADPTNTVLPAGSRIGDEITAQRFKRSGTDPVTLQPLAVFGPTSSSGRVGRIGWVPPAGAAARTDLLTVPNAAAQDVDPALTGTSSFDPGSAEFGLFATFESLSRVAYTQDSLNTLGSGGGPSHQSKVFQVRQQDGTPVKNAYVVTFDDAAPGASSDYNDVVLIVRGVEPVDVGAARLQARSLDAAAFPDRLTFNRIGAVPSPYLAVDHQHDEAVVRIENAGGATAQVSAITASGPFTVVSPPALPLTVAAGGSFDVRVRFTATSGRVSTGRLLVTSNATATGTVGVDLAGYWQSIPEGGQEPKLTEIVRNLYGYGTSILGSGQTLNRAGHVETVGDEVLSPYWKRVDPTRPAKFTQLAAFHTAGNKEAIRMALRGAEKTAARSIGEHDGLDAQSLLPHPTGIHTSQLSKTFSPPASFALNIANEWSDPAMNSTTADVKNGCAAPCGHHVRAWPVKDRIGRPVPGSYLVAMDYSGINYDYNDNVYLFENVEPDIARPVLKRLNVGSTASYTDKAGMVWTPDAGLFAPSTAKNEGVATDAITATADDPLYATYRGNVGAVSQDQRVLSYSIPVTGASRVDVRLLMAERANTAVGARVFDVFAENLLRIDDLDLFARAGGKNIAWQEEIRDVDVSDGVLTLRLVASKDYPALSGIEVRCSAGCAG